MLEIIFDLSISLIFAGGLMAIVVSEWYNMREEARHEQRKNDKSY